MEDKSTYFLNEVAIYLQQSHLTKLHDCTLVFPNRRAILYFQKYLALLNTKPQWAPQCITINELMKQLSGLSVAENITLNFELHRIYKEEKKSDESFDKFYYWGDMLLNDFDDIDKYLVDAALLFKTLASIKEIDRQFNFLTDEQIEAIKQFWKSFEPNKYSEHQKEFVELWQVLNNIYTKFKNSLASRGIAYEGMIWREVAEKCTNKSLAISDFYKIIFIGFNALNNCEKTLFEYLQNECKAEFYWDYDEYYLKNVAHEAGYFLRENIQLFPSPLTDIAHNQIAGTIKNIQFIGASSDIAQTKLISEVLTEWRCKDVVISENTVVILADESLLLPVLNSIPDENGAINVTMGYPLNSAPAYTLFTHLLDLQKSAKIKEDGKILFYFRSVLKILNHQFLKSHSADIITEISQQIIVHNRVYIQGIELNQTELLRKIFTYHDNAKALTEHLLDIMSEFYNLAGNDAENPTLEQEYIYYLYSSIKKLYEIIISHNISFGLPIYYRLLKQTLSGVRIPFEGEPLKGLQVMGILETRAIDFDNIIMISTNEGILPAGSAGSSFVPYNLRRAFTMPTIEHRDSIYAYYFYRLLHGAKNVAYIYNSGVSEKSTGEMSRFMLQLKYLSNLQIVEKNLVYDIAFSLPQSIEIIKTEKILKLLDQYQSQQEKGLRSFSASALNMYLDCSLKFYFRYIASLEEADEVTEDIDAAIFGRLLHKAMEHLYKDFINTNVEKTHLVAIVNDVPRIEQSIIIAFQIEYFKSDKPLSISDITGKNILIFEVIKKYISQILKYDMSQTPFLIHELEGKYNVVFPFIRNNKKYNINLGGFLDRIEKNRNTIKIIDYKTGKESMDFSSINHLFFKGDIARCKEAFQTLFYCLVYLLKNPDTPNVCPSLYYVRSLFSDNYNSLLLDKTSKTFVTSFELYAEEFTNNLEELFLEMLDQKIPFTQTQEKAICKYCAYIDICHR